MNKLHAFGVVLVMFGLWIGVQSVTTDFSTVKIYFFYGNTFDQNKFFALNDARSILSDSNFDNTKPTMLYVPGYVENMESESVHVIADAYIQRNEHHTLILDWSVLAGGDYLTDAVPNTQTLGEELAKILIDLFNNGLDISIFHLIGHSLGAQVVGAVGRNIQNKSTLKLKRISGLDPAFPGFYPSTLAISRNDAELVDIIHTDQGYYGAPYSTGSVDFWPNGGKTLQPGCPIRNYQFLTDNDLCSHRRSWRFWAESVANKNQHSFNAVKALSWLDFKQGRVIKSPVPTFMGIDCTPGLTGNYFLQTNAATKFSRGESGTTYQDATSNNNGPLNLNVNLRLL